MRSDNLHTPIDRIHVIYNTFSIYGIHYIESNNLPTYSPANIK